MTERRRRSRRRRGADVAGQFRPASREAGRTHVRPRAADAREPSRRARRRTGRIHSRRMLHERAPEVEPRFHIVKRRGFRRSRPRSFHRLFQSSVGRSPPRLPSRETHRHHRRERIGYRYDPSGHVYQPSREMRAREFFRSRIVGILPPVLRRLLLKPVRRQRHRIGMRRQLVRTRHHARSGPILTFALPRGQSQEPARNRAIVLFRIVFQKGRRPRRLAVYAHGIRRTQFLLVERRTVPYPHRNRRSHLRSRRLGGQAEP